MNDANGFAVSAFAAYNIGKKTQLHKNTSKKNKKRKPNSFNAANTIPSSIPQNGINNLKQKNRSKNAKKKKSKSGGEVSPATKISQLVTETSKIVFGTDGDQNSEADFQLPKKEKKRKNSSGSSTSTTTSKSTSTSLKKRKKNMDSQEDLELVNTEVKEDSFEKGKDVFKWIIDPIPIESFFKETWEKTAIFVNRHGDAEYFQSLLSTPLIDQILRQHNLYFGRNIDITSFTDDKRETHNPECRALPPIVWDYYSNGCSVRLLNPQSYSRKLHQAISYLQEYVGTFVGANAYLTPADSQGFAPHYDDIEAFILQVEGKKHWKLYAPRNPDEILPRFSSPNFSESDLPDPTMEVTLKAGDLLYFPRGTIHQGKTVPGEHSLHITLSFYQKTSWTDFLEKLLPATLKIASEINPEFREGLPMHFMDVMGEAKSKSKSSGRTSFCKKLESLVYKMFVTAPVDAIVDQMGKQFQHDALPPVLTAQEKKLSAYGDGERMGTNGVVYNRVELMLDSKIKLLRKNILRLVKEDDTTRIYHHAYNTKFYHETEPQFFEIEDSVVPAIEALIRQYPHHTKVEDLPIPDNNDSSKIMALVADLWERGLLLTEEPLPVLED